MSWSRSSIILKGMTRRMAAHLVGKLGPAASGARGRTTEFDPFLPVAIFHSNDGSTPLNSRLLASGRMASAGESGLG